MIRYVCNTQIQWNSLKGDTKRSFVYLWNFPKILNSFRVNRSWTFVKITELLELPIFSDVPMYIQLLRISKHVEVPKMFVLVCSINPFHTIFIRILFKFSLHVLAYLTYAWQWNESWRTEPQKERQTGKKQRWHVLVPAHMLMYQVPLQLGYITA